MRPALILLVGLLVAPPLCGQTPVHRCVGTDGTPMFTDRACDQVGAVPMGAATAAAPESGGGPRQCPATLEALKARVAAAFNARDPNALAGLMLWQGVGTRAAVADVQRLRTLVDTPLLEFRQEGTRPITPVSPDAPMIRPDGGPVALPGDGRAPALPTRTPDTLVLKLGGVGHPDEARFAIVANAGCLWLQP